MKKVLFITTPRKAKWFEQNNATAKSLIDFKNKVNKNGISLAVSSIDRLEFKVDKTSVQIWDNYNECDIADFDLIHLRNVDKAINLFDYAWAITDYIRHNGGDVVEEVDQGLALGKLSQMVTFQHRGLPVPRTVASWDNETLKCLALAELSFPMIVKANNAMQGSDNHLVHTKHELDAILNGSSEQYVAQEFIPNDGDYRVLFNGYSQPPLIFKRQKIEGSHLSNTSKGSEAQLQTPDALGDGVSIALEAAKAVNRKFTGIDIMQNNVTNEWVLLEANVNPALATGVFRDTKAELYAKMITERVGK